MSESFEPVYYVSEHGKVQRLHSGSRLPIPTVSKGVEGEKKKERNIYVVIPKDVEDSMKLKIEKMNRVPIKQNNSNNSFNINDHKGHCAQSNNSNKAQARNTMNLKMWC